MRSPRIPANPVHITGKEAHFIADAIKRGRLCGDNYYTLRCKEWLERKTGCNEALLTHSCTAALELAALLLDIKADDEVIMPSFTFSSTATAFVMRGATPVFVDIDPDTLCLNPEMVKAAISPNTKAIAPVHYAGLVYAIDEILALGEKHGIPVIEDAAQALGSVWEGRAAGSFGQLGCLSFHESKNIQCGEGGAILINDASLCERARVLREKGTNRSAFLHGLVDKYTWIDTGSSYLPSELQAAFLYAQLQAADSINESRRQACAIYDDLLAPAIDSKKIRTLDRKNRASQNGHIYWILTANLEERTALQKHLKRLDIDSFFHYVPLHSSPAGLRYGKTQGDLTVTDAVYERLLRLPLEAYMPYDDIKAVADGVNSFYGV